MYFEDIIKQLEESKTAHLENGTFRFTDIASTKLDDTMFRFEHPKWTIEVDEGYLTVKVEKCIFNFDIDDIRDIGVYVCGTNVTLEVESYGLFMNCILPLLEN